MILELLSLFLHVWAVHQPMCLAIQVVKEVIDPLAKIEFRENTADDPHKRKPDISKAKELLGWEPKVSLKEGLPRMVEDFRGRIFGDRKEKSAGSE
jgi:UDP-glucuronate decarboxylase